MRAPNRRARLSTSALAERAVDRGIMLRAAAAMSAANSGVVTAAAHVIGLAAQRTRARGVSQRWFERRRAPHLP
jgi:hypothetical protein